MVSRPESMVMELASSIGNDTSDLDKVKFA
jgi:hypothetical protein